MIDYWLQRYLAGLRCRRIMDIGPGYNTFALAAAQITGAQDITYVDYARDILDWQVARARAKGLQATGICGDLNENADLSTLGSFDLILCQEVLEHLPRPAGLIGQMTRLLAPGGRILITVPTAFSERIIKRINPAYMKDEPYGHVQQFTRRGLRELLASSSLRVEVLHPIQPHYFIGHLWLFGTRVKIEGATGKILDYDWRAKIFNRVVRYSRFFFRWTFPLAWGWLFPRNYLALVRRTGEPA